MAYLAMLPFTVVLVVALWIARDDRRSSASALEVERARIDRLLDRLQARSLEHYHAFDQVAANLEGPEHVEGRWVHDDTGLISSWSPD